jgi:hypothetical protein
MHSQLEDPSIRRTFVLWSQIYDELMRFHLFGLDCGFSGSGDTDAVGVEVDVEVAVDISMEGDRTDETFERRGFAQQLERVPLSFCDGGIVCVCVCTHMRSYRKEWD